MKKTIFTLAFAFVAFFAVNTAQAQNAHFTDVVVNGLTVTGKVAGLGSSSGLVTVVYAASVTASKTCSTRGNDMEVPPFTETASATASDTYRADRNGRITFSLTLDISQMGSDFDFNSCPNGLVENIVESVLSKSLTFSTASGRTGSYEFAE
ncbi:hypothetical protein D770_10620 [Flammeovirgaceae bacterium 311]|nr:hypothetical protein D770_10620 [Flammeovirgaceae bacterium 311]